MVPVRRVVLRVSKSARDTPARRMRTSHTVTSLRIVPWCLPKVRIQASDSPMYVDVGKTSASDRSFKSRSAETCRIFLRSRTDSRRIATRGPRILPTSRLGRRRRRQRVRAWSVAAIYSGFPDARALRQAPHPRGGEYVAANLAPLRSFSDQAGRRNASTGVRLRRRVSHVM
jgi:hypothetical protein